MKPLLIITTCPDPACAETIAGHLVRERLAACVNIIPGMQSIYQWQGEMVTERETILLIKTRAGAYARVEEAIRRLHPYELPEVIAVPIERGSADYLAWINSLVDN